MLALAAILTSRLCAGEKPARSPDVIYKTLQKILSDDKDADENTRALQRLKAYRYLAEVPYEDLTLDPEYNKACQAGAKLCEMIGMLEHTPKNPGLPEEEFKLAYKGTSRSNLGQGYRSLVKNVDGWMDDSDPNNIKWLGHRRWCINPFMQKTGFGRSGVYSAMYTFDQGRTKVPKFDFVCFPAKGYMPIEFFGAKYAWSVSLNPNKYKTPGKDYVPKLYRADETGAKEGEPLSLNYQAVNTQGFGIPNCIIFRPEKLSMAPGARYLVELEGIQPLAGKPVTLRYGVEFISSK